MTRESTTGAAALPETMNKIMEQAQVFASAWSLVGGQFDRGDGLEHAEAMKAELKAMLHAALSAAASGAPVAAAPMSAEPSDDDLVTVGYKHRVKKNSLPAICVDCGAEDKELMGACPDKLAASETILRELMKGQ